MCNVNPSGNGMNGAVYDACAVGPTLTTNKGEGNKVVLPVLTPDRAEKIGNCFPSGGENGNIWWGEGVAPTLKAGVGVYDFRRQKVRDDGMAGTISCNANVTGCGVFGAMIPVEVEDEE